MKRFLLVLLGCGLAATWVGCQGAADSTTPDATDSTDPAAATADDPAASTTDDQGASVADDPTSEFTLVSLKVPNMT